MNICPDFTKKYLYLRRVQAWFLLFSPGVDYFGSVDDYGSGYCTGV